MSKIQRANTNILPFAGNAQGFERTVFGGTDQSDDLTDNLNAAFLRGWGIVTPNEAPTKQDFNAMAFTMGQLTAYLYQMGIAEWNSLQEYNTGSISLYSGVMYQSLIDDNIGYQPDTSSEQWKLIIQFATPAQAVAGTDNATIMSPAGVKDAMGQFGLFGNTVYIGDASIYPSMDQFVVAGEYYVSSSTTAITNRPTTVGFWLSVRNAPGNSIEQFARGRDNNKTYLRHCINGVWETVWQDITPAPLPIATAGQIGTWVLLSSGIGNALSLPANGQWAFFATRYASNVNQESAAGVLAGGTLLWAAASNNYSVGFAWRIA
jgi:hypothetical protein